MTLRVFVSGQSNAVGRGAGGPDWSTISPDVRVWNNVNPLGANGSAFTTAALARAGGTFENTDRNNFGVWFCDRLARETGQDVDMTMVARGASSIIEWGAAGYTYPLRQECIDVWAATGQGPAHVFLWHQGEGDASSMDHAEWQSRFLDLCAALTAAGVIDAGTVILLGGVADALVEAKRQFNSDVLQQLAATQPRFGYASPRALATTDGTHFDGTALYTFGAERYYTAYLRAQSMSTYALVNEGGDPGVPGSGTRKILNLDPILNNGFRLRGGPLYLTTSQTYERDDEVVGIMVEAQGAGGGGAGAISGGVPRASSGGGAGGYARTFIENPESSYAVVIGAAGTGGPVGATAGESSGAAGGATTFGAVLTAEGGNGGLASGSTATQALVIGSVGGAASGGDFAVRGGAGGNAIKMANDMRASGRGADSRYGYGGGARSHASTSGNSGIPAEGYGSGGGGATSSDTTGNVGGNGAPGLVVVWEFIR